MKGGFHGGSKYDARPMWWWEPVVMGGVLIPSAVMAAVIGCLPFILTLWWLA